MSFTTLNMLCHRLLVETNVHEVELSHQIISHFDFYTIPE